MTSNCGLIVSSNAVEAHLRRSVIVAPGPSQAADMMIEDVYSVERLQSTKCRRAL